MSFAKRAADELMGDDVEAERQAKRQKWMHLLGTLATGAGAVGGAYYLGKNNGEHWNQGMKWLGDKLHAPLTSPDPKPSGIQKGLDTAVRPLGVGKGSLTPQVAGALAGGALGAALPGSATKLTTGLTSGNIQRNAANPDAPISKNLAALGGKEGIAGEVPKSVLDQLSSAGNPVDPHAPIDQAPLLAQAKSVYTGKPVSPVLSGQGINPIAKMRAALQLRQARKGLDMIHSAAPGTNFRLKDNLGISGDDLKARFQASGFDAGRLSNTLRAARFNSAPPSTMRRGVFGALGTAAGAYLGNDAEISSADAANPPPLPHPVVAGEP